MFHRSKSGAVDVVHATVSINMSSREELQGALEPARSGGRPMAVLDLSDVELIDSSGLEEIVEQHRHCVDGGGDLKLSSPSPLIEDVLRVTGIDQRIEVHETVKSAVGSFLR